MTTQSFSPQTVPVAPGVVTVTEKSGAEESFFVKQGTIIVEPDCSVYVIVDMFKNVKDIDKTVRCGSCGLAHAAP